jgi:2-polyprenyl-6-methoxyphenol hydroxylase-like FAD-dependent oxidoreductase
LIRRALVVGGGIAGMASAIMLRRNGVPVDLIDLDPEWRVYGAGITITGPTLRAFEALGILDRVIADAHTADGVQVCDVAGEPLSVIPTPSPAGSRVPGSGGIMRPTLHKILSGDVLALGANVRLGITVDEITNGTDAEHVRFSDGTSGDYDLVVGADGLYSKVRTLLFPNAPVPQFTGQACWRLMTRRLPGIDRRHYFLGGPVKAGLTPVSASEMYMFVLENVDVNVRVDPAVFYRKLSDLLVAYGGPLAEVRAALNPESSIVYRPLETMLLPAPWHAGRTVIVGDAAHATTPQLASGAGMAVEDGLVVAQEMQRAATVEEGLRGFMRRRYERCRLVVENSVQLGRYEVDRAPVEAQTSLVALSLEKLAEAI